MSKFFKFTFNIFVCFQRLNINISLFFFAGGLHEVSEPARWRGYVWGATKNGAFRDSAIHQMQGSTAHGTMNSRLLFPQQDTLHSTIVLKL
jgi:hypothetical protein